MAEETKAVPPSLEEIKEQMQELYGTDEEVCTCYQCEAWSDYVH